MKRLVLAFFFPAASGAAASPPREILVFGAASLSESLQDAGKQFEENGGGKVAFFFGSSGALARQIATRHQGMRAGRAAGAGSPPPGEFLSNALVVIVPSNSTAKVTSAKDLESFP